MKFSASLVALVAAALVVEAVPVTDRRWGRPSITDNQNANIGSDQTNQEAGGAQVVRGSDNRATTGGLLSGLRKRHGTVTFNDNENDGSDQANQESGGVQVVRGSDNRQAAPSGLVSGLTGSLGLKKRGYEYDPTANENDNIGSDQGNQESGGVQVIRGSDNRQAAPTGLVSGLTGSLGLKKRGYEYDPTANENDNIGSDQGNQETGGVQVIRNSDNRQQAAPGLVSGLTGNLGLKKRGYGFDPTLNDNENIGSDQTNQEAGGAQVIRNSDNRQQAAPGLVSGLTSGLGLKKRHYGFGFSENENENVGSDQTNQESGGAQVIRGSDSRQSGSGSLLGGLTGTSTGTSTGLLKRNYGFDPTFNENDNIGSDQSNQEAGGAQVIRNSDNRQHASAGLVSGLTGSLGLKKRGYGFDPTVNDNDNIGSDQANQEAGGVQVIRNSDNRQKAAPGLVSGLTSGLGLKKRNYGFGITENDNENDGSDQSNQESGGAQVVRGSDSRQSGSGSLLGGLTGGSTGTTTGGSTGGSLLGLKKRVLSN